MKRCAGRATALLFSMISTLAFAQAYPAMPVRVLIPLPPGTPAEVTPRAMSLALGKALGQPFVVDNRPGADGFIASQACARAAPDGYTICGLTQSQVVLNSFFHEKLPYDPERDFTPIGYLGTFTSALVISPKIPANTVGELVALAKSKPDFISWATLGGTGLAPLYLGWMKQNAGASFYPVPYKSTAEGVRGVIAGDVDAVVVAVGPIIPQVRAGKLKALAVTTGKRWPAMPEVPTLKEAGFDVPVSFNAWVGMFAPSGTPEGVVRRLNSEMVKIMDDPAFKAQFITAIGLEADDHGKATASEFAAFIKNDRQVMAKSVTAAGIKKQ